MNSPESPNESPRRLIPNDVRQEGKSAFTPMAPFHNTSGMRGVPFLSQLCLLATAVLIFAQSQPPQPPTSQTSPRLSPDEEKPSLTKAVLTPEFLLPDGFTFRADQIDLEKLIEEESSQLDTRGDIRMRTDKGDSLRAQKARFDFDELSASKVTLSDQVSLRSSNGIEVFADTARIDESTQSIIFTGNVSAYQGSALHRGDSVTYNYQSRNLSTNSLRTSFAPILLESGSFQAVEREEGSFYKGTNAGITTHDVDKPNFWLRGEEVTLLPGDKVRFKNMKLYTGSKPVLWLPSLTQTYQGEFNYRPTPGFRTNWGAFLLNSFTHDVGGRRDPQTGFRNNPSHKLTWHGDLYSRRGLGLGADLVSYAHHQSNPNLTGISGYFIYDLDPTEARSSEPRLNFDQNERYRFQIRERADVDWLPGATGHLDLNVTLLSDRFFLEDFRTQDFTTDFQPDNTLSLSQSWKGNHLLTAWTRFRINDHFQSDQRLPEIAFDQVRRPVLGTPILHESQNTVGIYREELADFFEDELRAEQANPATSAERNTELIDLLADTGFARFHTYHELSLPLTLDSGLHITPRVGAGHTSYQDIAGPLNSFNRNILHASIDASLKFTKRYPDWISKKWGLNSALHVLQPYATATILETDDLPAGLQPIDRLTATTRPRGLNPGRFAALDNLTDWQILRLGTRNRILTKRDNTSHQWLSVDTYVDVFGTDPEFDRSISNFYTDVHWSPLPWLDLTVETQLPLFSDSNFTEVVTGLEFMPNENTEFEISHRFLEGHPILSDSNRLQLSAYHRINEAWGVSATQRWEFADSTLEFQEYSAHRNLDSWALTAGFFSRDNGSENEFGFLFGFTLTDFPSVNLPLRVNN